MEENLRYFWEEEDEINFISRIKIKLDNLIKEFKELDRLVYTGNLNLQKKEKSLSNKLTVAKGRYSNSKR